MQQIIMFFFSAYGLYSFWDDTFEWLQNRKIAKSDSVASHLLKLLRDNPDDWNIDNYKLTHKPSDVRIWIANGRSFVSVIDHSSQDICTFNAFEKHLIWKAYKKIAKYKQTKAADALIKKIASV